MVKFYLLKELSPIALDFFKTAEILISEQSSFIFLITSGEFYSWKMFHLEDIDENVTSCGNHN